MSDLYIFVSTDVISSYGMADNADFCIFSNMENFTVLEGWFFSY
jgi:hypothetical protein